MVDDDLQRALVAACLVPGQAAVEARLHVPGDLPLFAGHFPGYPLVPGAVLIEAVRSAVARATDLPLAITSVAQAKFTREVRPNEDILLHIALEGTPTPGVYLDAVADLRSDAGPVARIRLTLRLRD